MSHSPPVPQGNQSPYPIQEPPHTRVHTPAHDDTADRDRPTADDEASIVDQLRALPLVAVGAAIGLGAALVGGAVFALTRDSAPKPRKRGRKKS